MTPELKASEASEKLRAQVEAARAAAAVPLRELDLEELSRRCDAHEIGSNANGWVNPYPGDDPRSLLLEYQFGYFHDRARFKCALMARQTGKDFTSEGEAAEDCMRQKTEWMIAGPSERQTLDSLDQGKTWAEAFHLKVADYNEVTEGGSEALLKSAEIVFSNGSRMRAVPGNPKTVRGRSANLLATEVDFFEQPDDTWRAILPSITNPLRGGQKKVRLITTPNGLGGLMHKIWNKPDTEKMRWSRHRYTIYHAVLMGLPVDVAELREAFSDPDGWAQEFECQFLDTASVLLPYELLVPCENPLASAEVDASFWAREAGGSPLYLGIDFGRTTHLTVCWTLELVGGAFKMTREVLELRNMSTPDQLEVLLPRLQRARRVCLDYTGPGIGLGDLMVEPKLGLGQWEPEHHRYGRVELCTFSNAMKLELFPALRVEFEKRLIGTPVSRAIREDLHSMHRVVTAAGNVTYKAPMLAGSHADRCTALALALRAVGSGSAGAITAEILSGIQVGTHVGRRPVYRPRRLTV